MSKLLWSLIVLFFIPFSLMAQNKTITGKIVDESGNPVVGANVIAKGSTRGTQTNNTGNFSISVPGASATTDLVVSSVGYASKVITVTGNDAGTVQIVREIVTQEDVVVVGYATIKRKDLTGSVSSVNAKELKDFPLSSAAEALQGKLAGVQLISTEGAPGADIIVRVRGGGSITQDNSPLYIVDGVQVENALSVISPQDIATVDVLKDASTTAIYGARGANGVVIITTKGGKPGKTQITYNGSYGIRKLSNFQDVMSPYDFVVWQWERMRAVGGADTTNFFNTYGTNWDTLKNYQNVPAVNWQDRVFGRNAKFSNHNVAVSGGDQKTTFNLSLTANKEEGVQITTGFERKSVNFKIDHKATDRLRIGFTARYIDQQVDGAGTTNGGTRTTNRLRHTIN
ncbi:MAG: TonB-dependent receptor plug domain-containing protein, partial [Ferruginibacter sp.]